MSQPAASHPDDPGGSATPWSMVSSTSELGASLNDLIGKLNDWEREYGDLLQELGAAHRNGDADRAARVEAAMRHVSFLFDATRARVEVMTSVHVATWSPLLAERAEAQGRQLSRATWVLAVATIGLMLATIALIVVTATAGGG